MSMMLMGMGDSRFSPLSLSPALWMDATRETYSDAGSTPAGNNELIAQWNDLSGNSRHFSQSTGASRPTLRSASQNGLSGAEFNGTSNVLTATIPNFANTSKTIFAVTKVSSAITSTKAFLSNGTGNYYIGGAGTPNSKSISSHQNSVGSNKTPSSSAGVFSTLVPVITAYRWSVSGSDVDVSHHLNGVTVASASYTDGYTASSPSSSWFLGAFNASSSFWPGLLYELIVVPSALTAAERFLVESYLGARWGSSVTDPGA